MSLFFPPRPTQTMKSKFLSVNRPAGHPAGSITNNITSLRGCVSFGDCYSLF